MARTALVVAVLLFATSDLSAQQRGGLAQQAVGTWAVVSQYVEQDGKRVQPFGESPKGRAMYDDKGRFMLIGHRSDLPKYASNDRMRGTAEEYRAIGQGTIAYYGTHTIDEKEGMITRRYFTSVGGGKAYLVLTRMK